MSHKSLHSTDKELQEFAAYLILNKTKNVAHLASPSCNECRGCGVVDSEDEEGSEICDCVIEKAPHLDLYSKESTKHLLSLAGVYFEVCRRIKAGWKWSSPRG